MLNKLRKKNMDQYDEIQRLRKIVETNQKSFIETVMKTDFLTQQYKNLQK